MTKLTVAKTPSPAAAAVAVVMVELFLAQGNRHSLENTIFENGVVYKMSQANADILLDLEYDGVPFFQQATKRQADWKRVNFRKSLTAPTPVDDLDVQAHLEAAGELGENETAGGAGTGSNNPKDPGDIDTGASAAGGIDV